MGWGGFGDAGNCSPLPLNAIQVADFNLSKVVTPMYSTASTMAGGVQNPTWLVGSLILSLFWLQCQEGRAASDVPREPLRMHMQAPEVLQDMPATAASDVYAFGLVMWEMLLWRVPWADKAPYLVRACKQALV